MTSSKTALRIGDPPRFNPNVAHPARVYNLWLGGKDGYAADREAAGQVARCRPPVVASARANRAFLARVVRYLAAQRGIRQFRGSTGCREAGSGNCPVVAAGSPA
jgi:S-adenosyl methyltransferase